VQSHLKSLEKRGLIHRDPTKPRALITRGAATPAAVAEAARDYGVLPIVGKVAAGVPITATENVEGEFVLPPEFARKNGTFMLRVQGDSMIDAAILDGDLIVVAPQPDAANGEIVVAMVDGEATVKRFFREAGRVRLQPENATMKPIFADDVTVIGRVGAVFRKL
jgi:repressor LexA